MFSAFLALISAASVLAQSTNDTAVLDAPRTTNVLASQCSDNSSLAILTVVVRQTLQQCILSQTPPRAALQVSTSVMFRETFCVFGFSIFFIELIDPHSVGMKKKLECVVPCMSLNPRSHCY